MAQTPIGGLRPKFPCVPVRARILPAVLRPDPGEVDV
jgi:hypothetical protein